MTAVLETWSDWSRVSVRKDQVQRCGAVCFCNSFSPLPVVTELLSQSIHTYKHSQTHLQTAASAAVSKKRQRERKAVFVFIMVEYICTAAVFSSYLPFSTALRVECYIQWWMVFLLQ